MADAALVLSGRCDQEAVVAYQPFVEMLDALAGHDSGGPAARQRTLPPGRSWLRSSPPWRHGLPRRVSDRAVLFDAVTQLATSEAVDRPARCSSTTSSGPTATRSYWCDTSSRPCRTLACWWSPWHGAISHPTTLCTRRSARGPPGVVGRIRPAGWITWRAERCWWSSGPTIRELLAWVPILLSDTSGNPLPPIEFIRALSDDAAPGGPESALASPRLRELIASWMVGLGRDSSALFEAAAVSEADSSWTLRRRERNWTRRRPGGPCRPAAAGLGGAGDRRHSQRLRLRPRPRPADALPPAQPGSATPVARAHRRRHRIPPARPAAQLRDDPGPPPLCGRRDRRRRPRGAVGAGRAADARAWVLPAKPFAGAAKPWTGWRVVMRPWRPRCSPSWASSRSSTVTPVARPGSSTARCEPIVPGGPTWLLEPPSRWPTWNGRCPQQRADASALIDTILVDDDPSSSGRWRLDRTVWARMVARQWS